jgi:hypothetical protein
MNACISAGDWQERQIQDHICIEERSPQYGEMILTNLGMNASDLA